MYNFPIGVLLDSFRTDYRTALKKASNMGVKGIQVYCTAGELSPEALTPAKRKEFLELVKSHGLLISALCGDLGHGFGNKEKNPALIERTKLILDLAKDLQTDVMTTHIGVIPEDNTHERYETMLNACSELCDYAADTGVKLAVETGPETAVVLKEFLDKLNKDGAAVNLDPANFVMITGDDPAQAVHTLKDYIVHTHAKDGKRLNIKTPEVAYGIHKDDNPSLPAYAELPLGKGSVNFKEYLKALNDIGYKGFLTIEREVGENPEEDIKLAVDFLKGMLL